MNFKYLIYIYSIMMVSSVNATGLLMDDLADPDAIVDGVYTYFTGTTVTELEKILIYRTTTANFIAIANGGGTKVLRSSGVNNNAEGAFITYDARKELGYQHRFCFVGAPDLHNDGINISLSFQAMIKPYTSDTCSVVQNSGDYDFAIIKTIFNTTTNSFGPADFIRSSDGTGPIVSTIYTANLGNFNHRFPRIDSEHFTDTDGITYWSYTWFTGFGNANSTIKLNNSNDRPIIDNTFPNVTYDAGITEAPNIFKRGIYYYLVYSEHLYFQYYQVYYKKAISVEGLKTDVPTCRLTFNSWQIGPNGINSGHGSVISIGSDDYFIYHIGSGVYNPAGITRDTYISKLDIDINGDIKQIRTPSTLYSNGYLGNRPGCRAPLE